VNQTAGPQEADMMRRAVRQKPNRSLDEIGRCCRPN